MSKCGLCGDVDGDGILTVNDVKLQWEYETGAIPISDLKCPQYRLWSFGNTDLKFKFEIDNCYNGTQVPSSPYQVYKNKYLFDDVIELIDSQMVPAFPENIQTPLGVYPDTKGYIDTINTALKNTKKYNSGTIDCCCKGGSLYTTLLDAYKHVGRYASGESKAFDECCKRCANGTVLNENDPCFDWCGCCEKNNNLSNSYNSQYNYLPPISMKPAISSNEWYVPGKVHAFKNMRNKDGKMVCSTKGDLWLGTLKDIESRDGNHPALEGWQQSNEELIKRVGYPSPGRWVRFKFKDSEKVICRKYLGRLDVEYTTKHFKFKGKKEEQYVINLDLFDSVFENFETCDQCMDIDPNSQHNCQRDISWCDFYNENKKIIDEMDCKRKCADNIDPTDPCFKFCGCYGQESKVMRMKINR